MDWELIQVAQITWSRELVIIEAEGACQLVLGAPAESLLGQPLHQTLRVPENRARELDQKALGASPAEVEFVYTGGDKANGVLRLALGRRNGNASAAVADLRRFLEGAPPLQISALSSSLSHEIRNPLSSVKMAVQTLARNSALSERDRRRLTIANREIRTMERMLWLFSEYGQDAPLTLESVPLQTLAQQAAALVDLELAERRVQVRIQGEATARAQVEAGQLSRVLAQLLLSIAMGQSEGSFLDVTILPAIPSGLEMQLHDNAAVAEPVDPSSMFAPFNSLLSRGAGLSLAALKRVMERHGGKLRADWSSGQGTLYTLSFPG
ncbi:MAG TPA: HAMP domain-containing sensor histidine kinase [Myxococcaceae bacterium]|nr:HAMP domain-containing sensor histidine kinase [Myxococcaceae bacterium]